MFSDRIGLSTITSAKFKVTKSEFDADPLLAMRTTFPQAIYISKNIIFLEKHFKYASVLPARVSYRLTGALGYLVYYKLILETSPDLVQELFNL